MTTAPSTVEGLLEGLGGALRAAPLGPDADFRDALRKRLVAVATVAPAAAPAVKERRFRATLGWRVAIGGLSMATTVAGITAAGVLALPGDAFYGLKHHEEGVELALAGSDEAKGLLHLRFAHNRLDEVGDLLDRAGVTDAAGTVLQGTPDASQIKHLSPQLAKLVASTLAEMDTQTQEGATLLTRTYLKQRKAAPLAKLATFATQQKAQLAIVTVVLPAKAKPAAKTSLKVLDTVATSTETLLKTTPPLVSPPTPSDPSPSVAPLPTPSDTPSPSPSAQPSDSPSPVATPSPSPSAQPSDSPSPAAPSSSPSPAAPASPSPATPSVAASSPATNATTDSSGTSTDSTGHLFNGGLIPGPIGRTLFL